MLLVAISKCSMTMQASRTWWIIHSMHKINRSWTTLRTTRRISSYLNSLVNLHHKWIHSKLKVSSPSKLTTIHSFSSLSNQRMMNHDWWWMTSHDWWWMTLRIKPMVDRLIKVATIKYKINRTFRFQINNPVELRQVNLCYRVRKPLRLTSVKNCTEKHCSRCVSNREVTLLHYRLARPFTPSLIIFRGIQMRKSTGRYA